MKAPERAGLVPSFRRWRDFDHRVVKCTALSYRARVVLVALLSFANEAGLCWPSLPRLTTEAGLSLATTKRALRELLGAAIVTRAGRSIFQLDWGRLTDVLCEPDRLTREPMDRLTPEPSIGSLVSRGDPPHPFLNCRKEHTQRELSRSPSKSPPEGVCAVDDLEARISFVATAFALPKNRDDSVIVPSKLHDAIAGALRSYTPAVLHRAVELARAQNWRSAELGAWCFTDESFLALVRKAQDESRARARTRTRPKLEAREKETTLTPEQSASEAANVLRALGVRSA